VKRVSEINQGLYDTFASPLVRSTSSEAAARAIRALNPARLERTLFSDLNPWMHWVKAMAETVRENRRPAAADNPFVQAERHVSERIEQALDGFRDSRDAMYEGAFKAIYGSPWLAAAVGLSAASVRRRGPRRGSQLPSWESEELTRLKRLMAESHIEEGTVLDGWVRIALEYQELTRLKRLMAESHIEEGTVLDGWVRIALYVAREQQVFDERPYNLARRMIDQRSPEARPSLDELKAAVKRQAFVLALDEERAVAALPKLLPEGQPRREALEGARLVAGAGGPLTKDQEGRFRRIERVLGLEAPQLRSVG